jgi:orotate phosphoribosyltransferase
MLKEERVKEILAEAGAVLVNDHFKYTSGKHGSVYVAKDKVYIRPRHIDELCMGLAERFADERMAGREVDVVLAPAIGAIDIKTGVSRLLDRWARGKREVFGVYAEHEEVKVIEKKIGHRSYSFVQTNADRVNGESGSFALEDGWELIVKKPTFGIKRHYGEAVRGKRVLVVEDILTTGGSARATVNAVRGAGGEVVGVGALVNRGGVSAADLGTDKLEALLNVKLDAYDPAVCPMCQAGMAFNEQFGHAGKK